MTSEPPRLLADMGVSRHVVDALRLSGYDAVHVFELGLHQAHDSSIFQFATAESRTVITFDLDFAEINLRAPHPHSGVILVRMRHPRSSIVLKRLRVVLSSCAEDLRAGAIVSLAELHYRVRRSHQET